MREYTYLAGDYDSDGSVIEKIQEWNKNDKYNLKFKDAHSITQSYDSSLNCSIKASLAKRMNVSHTFVLIVGDLTKTVKAGSCKYCSSYYNNRCYRDNTVSFESYVEFECRKAINDDLRIVVIYNSTDINKNKCPDNLLYKGIHIPAYFKENGKIYWNYNEIRDAIMNK